jgi:hypothetical protein
MQTAWLALAEEQDRLDVNVPPVESREVGQWLRTLADRSPSIERVGLIVFKPEARRRSFAKTTCRVDGTEPLRAQHSNV